MKRIFYLLALIWLFIGGNSFAKSIFGITVTSSTGGFPNPTYQEGFDSVESLIDSLSGPNLSNTGYTPSSPASGTLDFRGLLINLDYETPGSSLRLRIPSTGLDITFTGTGATPALARDASETLLLDWFFGLGGAELTKLQQALARETANDPIAGNPNSMMATQVEMDFNSALGLDENVDPMPTTETGEPRNVLSAGFEFSSLDQGGFDNKRYTVPIKYTIRSKTDPRRKYAFRIPVTRVGVAGAESFNVGFGTVVSLPVKDNWILTPSFTYGLGGSEDLGSAAQMVSGSLTSSYTLELMDTKLTMGNMVGYYKTLKLEFEDFTIDPDIANTVLRNALLILIPTENILKKSYVQLFIIDTQYFGTELFIEHYDDFGISFGFSKKLKLGATYLHSSKSKGFKLNFGYKF